MGNLSTTTLIGMVVALTIIAGLLVAWSSNRQKQPFLPIQPAHDGCVVGGCSGQLCVPAGEAREIVSTCEYRAEYACYQEASCERQASGKCGWTQTEALKGCLESPPPLDGSEPQLY